MLLIFLDDLVNDDAIVKIKCPYIVRDTSSAKKTIETKLVSYNNKL